ncbi:MULTISPECIES: DUF4258 domain-containing protein [Bacillus cereus group]|uniref:DUF4258 domain-containing protein n=1 Tax=Bacillus cereus TaxID=1396 RepID=A0A9W7PZ87_BACCE|nr:MULTISPECIES: DUF4258 domain-containing protein [Bacillus cereus group]EEM19318.1 hypothetical protein bthur0001_55210 [Bacillus thuringiensis serovar tochigiensis BGSC 4Y1]ALL11617.1 hypothetical protein BTXL6_27460 [Bacillus thuringiensis]ALL21756.1 hypothetical protein BTXL6_09895 [Bacillus thuringiensis]EJR72825.1 hypothetical protein IK9_05600 [Bacillus cereus VD166]KAA6449213.1 DUF4258 domain-containing protein [Bacillus cereus]
MIHLKSFWEDELREMRNALRTNSGFIVSEHFFKDRMLQRDISLMEVAEIILYGDIVEGFDVAKYPGYCNSDPVRSIIGKTSSGRILTVGVAIKSKQSFCVVTGYEGITPRLQNVAYDKGLLEENIVC